MSGLEILAVTMVVYYLMNKYYILCYEYNLSTWF